MRNDETKDIEFVRLASFANSTAAGFVLELLRNNGIRALLEGANFGALEPLLMPGGYSEVQLLVAEEDLARASALYEAYFTRGDALEPDQSPVEE
jgi:hypothetical protein